MYVNFEKFEKMMYYLRFYPVFRSKSSEKSSEKVRKFRKNFGNFGNWFFRMFGNFGNLEIPNFPKTSKKWRTIRTSEIRKYLFRLENWPESSAKSSECRALAHIKRLHSVMYLTTREAIFIPKCNPWYQYSTFEWE